MKNEKTGQVLWLTGLSGAGKSTVANQLKTRFDEHGIRSMILDGDEVRAFFENDLGYSEKDRTFNVKRIAFGAKLISDLGVHAIVANIAPYAEVRQFIRNKIPTYIEIYLDVSLEEARKRDVKGHYGKYDRGELKSVSGLDDRYDVPTSPHLVLKTAHESVGQSVQKIWNYLEEKKVLAR